MRGHSALIYFRAEYVQRFATKEIVDNVTTGEEDEQDAEMSDMGSISGDEEMEA